MPNHSTSPLDQLLVRYSNHTHVVCPRTRPTNGKLSLAATKRTCFESLFDYNAFITIFVPQRFGEPQRVQWCVFAITPATDYVPLAPTVFKFPPARSKKILDDRSFTKSATTLWKKDDLRSCKSLTFIRQGPLI